MKLKEILKIDEKEPFNDKSRVNHFITGYNQAIDEIGNMELRFDEEVIAMILYKHNNIKLDWPNTHSTIKNHCRSEAKSIIASMLQILTLSTDNKEK